MTHENSCNISTINTSRHEINLKKKKCNHPLKEGKKLLDALENGSLASSSSSSSSAAAAAPPDKTPLARATAGHLVSRSSAFYTTLYHYITSPLSHLSSSSFFFSLYLLIVFLQLLLFFFLLNIVLSLKNFRGLSLLYFFFKIYLRHIQRHREKKNAHPRVFPS